VVRKVVVLIFVFAVMFLLSCKSKISNNSSSKTNERLRLHDIWGLESWKNETKSHIILEIFPEESRISGEGPCNSFFGGLKLNTEQKKIAFTSIGATKRSCDNLKKEQTFFEYLSKINHYTLDKNNLLLYENNTLLLTFKKID